MALSPQDRGNQAEELVAQWLESAGYQIVARNLRLGHLEIDIVARAESLIVVVEVRNRGPTSFTTALSSISREKRRRLRMAGERLWARRYRNDATAHRLRYDVATVDWTTTPPKIEYIPAAF